MFFKKKEWVVDMPVEENEAEEEDNDLQDSPIQSYQSVGAALKLVRDSKTIFPKPDMTDTKGFYRKGCYKRMVKKFLNL